MTEKTWELGKFYRFKNSNTMTRECVFISKDGSAVLQDQYGETIFRTKLHFYQFDEVKNIHKTYVVITKSLGKIYSFSSVSRKEVEDYLLVNSVECLSDIKEIEIEEK